MLSNRVSSITNGLMEMVNYGCVVMQLRRMLHSPLFNKFLVRVFLADYNESMTS